MVYQIHQIAFDVAQAIPLELNFQKANYCYYNFLFLNFSPLKSFILFLCHKAGIWHNSSQMKITSEDSNLQDFYY